MIRRVIVLAGMILGSGLLIVTAQEKNASGVFTPAQAEAGRALYERTCGQCHTFSLMGRKGGGDNGEVPPIESLPDSWQKSISPLGRVPPLAGDGFLNRYGGKTVAQLIARFQETVDDPFLALKDVDENFTVNLTAYILLVNGAKPGADPLTREARTSVYEAVR